MMRMLGQEELLEDERITTLAAMAEHGLQEYVVSKIGEGYARKITMSGIALC